ncbi:MAG: hypothetical protein RL432_1202 [Bacteroidota bacterium]
MKSIISLTLFFVVLSLQAQSTVIGFAPQFKQQHFYLWKEDDFLSKKKIVVSETVVDDRGVFRFVTPKGPIQKYSVGTDELNGYFFAQNGGVYRLEFITESPQSISYSLQEEIELTFLDLDSNDINFKMLGFEAWIDEELSKLHFGKTSEGEMLRQITLLKLTILKDASTDTSAYFKEYLKYSTANTVENLKYMGAPSQLELFKTYFFQRPIQYHAPYYTEFFETFYNQFISQMEVNDASAMFRAYAALNLREQDSIISRHACSGDAELRSLINLYMLKQAMNGNFIPKSVVKANLKLQSEASPFEKHRAIATNLMHKFSGIELGEAFPFEMMKHTPAGNKPIYIHAYHPSNTRCIQEIGALRKLYGSYGSKIEFLTVYVDKPLSNETEKKALSQITWNKIALSQDDPFWNALTISTFPYYLMVDQEGNLLHAPALSPTPNGKYETIEKTFFDLIKP